VSATTLTSAPSRRGCTREPAPVCCRGLTKRWGDAVGVLGLDLEVQAGSVTGFLGANGAGKSTTLKLLAGLLRPTAGAALLWGRPAADAAARARLGYMPADPAFSLPLTGTQNLDLLAALHGRGAADRGWAADLLRLSEHDLGRPVGEYSSGMVQKLALVQAVQHHPDLVMLDEPANRLDPLVHRRFESLVRQIATSGRTVFLSSHTLSEVEDVCDMVAMIRRGELLSHRPVKELADLAGRRVRATFLRAPGAPPPGLIAPTLDGLVLTGRIVRGHLDPVRALLADADLVDLEIVPASLEDAFVELYGGDR
jgi:ABC-2 type transport system ATP-binding protein